jgi:hypothetical protein
MLEHLFDLGIGPWLTPLRGKIPVLDAWESQPPIDIATALDWLDAGYNLGLRTGSSSGFVVIDDDQPRHDGASTFEAPPTGLIAESPTGSRHYYYNCPDPAPRNSASKLAPHVDVRGEGGQVVVPPSTHPTEHREYVWVSTGEPGTLPDDYFGQAIALDFTTPVVAPTRTGVGWAQTALVREAARVRSCPEGARNDTLVRAAFKLGQIVAGGDLTADEVRAELASAAQVAGLPEREADRTITNGLRGAQDSPRTKPERPAPAPVALADTTRPVDDAVLIPGAHVLPGGVYVEQGNHAFSEQVLAAVDPEALYRRAGVVGEIVGSQFAPSPVNRLRSIIDESVRLALGKETKEDPVILFRTCTRDLAAVVLDYAQVRGSIRELRHLAQFPVCIGPSFDPAQPGWNETGGVYLAHHEVLEPLPLAEARAVLDNLVCDFPFAARVDMENFLGLLLTPMLRPAIDEPVPMHLIGSPMERTGKTKLAEIVLGCTITGQRAPAMQLGEREEEREKRILSVLLRGQGILHLDNLRDFIDSPALASLLTSSEYQGRVLGSSAAPSLPNGLTVVGTGNNVHATGEIAKRIVPIRLLPNSEDPETRTDFRHPDLLGFVKSSRSRTLAALLGLVQAWRDAGRPLHSAGFGGFERWTAVVGGILGVAGYTQWLSNLKEWRGTADDAGEETRALIAAWDEKWSREWTTGAALYELAVELDLFGWLDIAKTERGRRTMFGARVINRLANRVVTVNGGAKLRILLDGVGSRRRARLAAVEGDPQVDKTDA